MKKKRIPILKYMPIIFMLMISCIIFILSSFQTQASWQIPVIYKDGYQPQIEPIKNPFDRLPSFFHSNNMPLIPHVPIIYNAVDIETIVGGSVSYKGDVKAVDCYGNALDIEIDNSQVNLNEEGVYPLTYKATDKCGVFAVKTVNVYVSADNAVSEKKIEETINMVLKSIITDDMTDMDKCWAVYWYLHAIPYVDVVHSEDWRQNAYYVLTMRFGDCFGYYSASRLLLEALGYDVMQVVNCNGFNHTWCLVSIDDGNSWYHFDPTCWKWLNDIELCMVNDETLNWYGWEHAVSYSQASHDWDRSLYPASY